MSSFVTTSAAAGRLYARRRLANTVLRAFAFSAAGIGVLWLAAVLSTLVINGSAALFFDGNGAFSLDIFTKMTPPPGSSGGLLNAIFGSLVMTLFATLFGAPIGILAGTYLAEYSQGAKIAEVVRFINDILLSAPSIIVGLFVYEVAVATTQQFSAWAGVMALTIIVIPVVVRTSEDMLKLVPNGLREAAAALGAPKWKVIFLVSYRAAMQGLLTGVLLAVARISGETAPLLFTALSSQFWSMDMTKEMASLPVVIFKFALSPYPDWQRLAWGGALMITLAILVLNITARALASRSNVKK